MALEDEIKNAEKENNQGSLYYKLSDGLNQIRILCQPMSVSKCFVKSLNKMFVCYGRDKGCKYPDEKNKASIRWIAWVVDTLEPEEKQRIQLAELPHTIAKELVAIAQSPDYKFDGFPMPYDIYINRGKEGDKTTYKVTPARQDTPVSQAILDDLAKREDVKLIIDKMKAKAMEADGVSPETPKDAVIGVDIALDDPNPDDIPF